MDRIAIWSKAGIFFQKYKYVVLILVLGILLMLLPEKSAKENIPETVMGEEATVSLAEQLEEILCRMEGVGAVRVLLTVSAEEETIFQTNENQTDAESSGSIKTDTVIISDTNRNQQGLVRKVISPIYQGAIVVCQGGDQPTVKFAVTQAVANATGLRADCISVLKMK